MKIASREFLAPVIFLCVISASSRAVAQSFHVIALPDTQGYSASYPAIFTGQTQWIVNNLESQNIAFVTHLGDIVDDSTNTTQWNRADAAMDLLDGKVPYSACMGNHDSVGAGYVTYFGPDRYAGQEWYGGSSENMLSHYQCFSAGGYEFLHLNIQYSPNADTLAWAQSVIDAHPGLPTIISTHDYLGTTGRSLLGESIWQNLVKDNPQVFMVLNGHWHDEMMQTSLNSTGGRVVEMLSDYQNYSRGGDGYLRDIFFDVANGRIDVKTYSPTLNAYLTDADSQFSFDVTFGSTIQINHVIEPNLPPPPAYTLTFQEGVSGYVGTQDTGLAFGTPGTVQGNATSINVGATGTPPGGFYPMGTSEPTPTGPAQGLVRFDNIFGDTVGKIAPGMKVTSATLTLVTESGGSGWSLHPMLTGWSESSTWNSMNDGIQADGIEAAVTAEGSIGANNSLLNVMPGRWEFDVSDSVKAWQEGQANNGWALLPYMPNGSSTIAISSSENIGTCNRPVLKVTVEMDDSLQQAVFQQGRNGYKGTHDMELRQEEPDTPYVYETALTITSNDHNSGYGTQNLIRFDQLFGSGPGQIPLDADIAFARLILNVTADGSGFRLHRMLQPWDETTTWNLLGEDGVQADGVEARITPDIQVGANNYYANIPTGWLQLDVTEALRAWQAGEANYGWVLIPYVRGGNGLDFSSSKYQYVSLRPMLVVDYAVPEPLTAMLLIMGIGLVRYRR